MKNFHFIIVKILLSGFLLISSVVLGQVGIGTTDPDASSMLDIQSTTKGMLIPRMDSSQRTSISSPANGLLVFDTDTQSFWFYSSSWTELKDGTPDKIINAEGDTRVEVEKTTDEDKIRLTTNGSERMTIDNAGNTRIGDGTNNTFIESDGSLSYEGTATRYDDLRVPVNSTTAGDTNPPDWVKLRDDGGSSQGVFIPWFNKSYQEELYFVLQMPHSWKEGTDIYPHIHWVVKSNVGDTNVSWGLEYTWSNAGEVFGNSTIITGFTRAVGSGLAYQHNITSLGVLSPSSTSDKISSFLVCRVFRDASSGNDDYSSDAGLLEIDFHYQIDSDGSRELYAK
jgi:hypothetical protein